MKTQSIISVNPTSAPLAAIRHNTQASAKALADTSVRTFQKVLRILLGVRGSAAHSRRIWTFRVIIGTAIMCFGLLFSHSNLIETTDSVIPGLSYGMLAGGAMIACGLLTRIVSIAMGAVLTAAAFQIGLHDMLGFTEAVCGAMCVASMICGSGRYSLDTIIYNSLTPIRNMRGLHQKVA